MTARLPGWSRGGGLEPVPEDGGFERGETVKSGAVVEAIEPGRVSGAMIDEAVEAVLRKQRWPADTAELLKFNLARDSGGDVSQAYYASKVAAHRTAVTGVARHNLTIKYVLNDEEVSALTEYAPSFKLRFENRESHDHAMGAACRLIDHKLIRARLPYGVPFSDVGGNPMFYAKAGDVGVHVCGEWVDVKDPMRHVLRRLEAKTLASETTNESVRHLAQQVAAGDVAGGFMCGKRGEMCDVQTPILISIHVYDIPLQTWPAIMERKGAQVVEGCLLFSDRFWEETSGVLGVSGARYEIDVKNNRFRMGFKDSPSWWYEHDWAAYMLYGTDQTIHSANCSYSYKVLERRGNTLFFRILRVETPRSVASLSRSYKMPGMPVVKVHGFELSGDSAWMQPAMKRKSYVFPAALWYEMVSQASEDFERGAMDYLRMYNHYRTISVRQTVNAVLVMGGEQVSQEELVPLVVHSCLAAAAMSLLGQRVTRHLTSREMRLRTRADETTALKVCKALASVAKTALLAPLVVFKPLAQLLEKFSASWFEQWVLEWEPVSELVTMDPMPLFDKGYVPTRPVYSEVVLDAARNQAVLHPLAMAAQDPKLAELFAKVCPGVVLPSVESESSPVVASSDEGGKVSFGGGVGCEESSQPSTAPPTYVSGATDQEQEVRRAAIREHLVEVQMSNQAVAATCARAYRTLMLTGAPSVQLLRDRAELFKNPDMWYVEHGVVIRSALGLPASDFQHSAVYVPVADSNGDCVRAVHLKKWSGVEGGVNVQREHRVLADESFSGWALVVDGLVVYNGPEVMAAMQRAIDMDHSYEVEIHQGPPGCGKTHSIIQAVRPDGKDVVMCPVRESSVDTRDKLLEKYPDFPDSRMRVRTVDSYLVGLSYVERTRNLRADTLYADECYMAHAGKWYAAAALLGVRKVKAYGDIHQIPHIPRVQAPKAHVRIKGKLFESFVTYRCPASAVAAWGGVYGWQVRAESAKVCNMVEVTDTAGREIPRGCVMMCMYQADKSTLRKLYGHRPDVQVLTSHESEGKSYEHVWLHRFDGRKRTDDFNMFDKQAHVLVAMSRHTKSFVYVRPAPLGDLVSKWIAVSRNERRLAAAADVKTAGESREYL